MPETCLSIGCVGAELNADSEPVLAVAVNFWGHFAAKHAEPKARHFRKLADAMKFVDSLDRELCQSIVRSEYWYSTHPDNLLAVSIVPCIVADDSVSWANS